MSEQSKNTEKENKESEPLKISDINKTNSTSNISELCPKDYSIRTEQNRLKSMTNCIAKLPFLGILIALLSAILFAICNAIVQWVI